MKKTTYESTIDEQKPAVIRFMQLIYTDDSHIFSGGEKNASKYVRTFEETIPSTFQQTAKIDSRPSKKKNSFNFLITFWTLCDDCVERWKPTLWILSTENIIASFKRHIEQTKKIVIYPMQ